MSTQHEQSYPLHQPWGERRPGSLLQAWRLAHPEAQPRYAASQTRETGPQKPVTAQQNTGAIVRPALAPVRLRPLPTLPAWLLAVIEEEEAHWLTDPVPGPEP